MKGGDSTSAAHWEASTLLHHEMGWLPRLEAVFVRHHVESCPACTVASVWLRFAAELVGLDLTRPAARR